MGLSSEDGVTPVPIKINAATGAVRVVEASVAFPLATRANRDGNSVPTKLGQADGGTYVLPIYVSPTTGAILIDK